MTVNVAGHVSNAFLIAALVVYSCRWLHSPATSPSAGRAGRRGDAGAAGATARPSWPRWRGGRGRGGGRPRRAELPRAPPGPAGGEPADDAGTMPELGGPALRAIREAGRWVVAAVAFAAIGAAALTTAVITRGWRSTARPRATCTSSSTA